MEGLAILICGIDFTSSPSARKPITCAICRDVNGQLILDDVKLWSNFTEFELWLQSPGPWLAACDFPFSFPRRFLQGAGFPSHDWSALAAFLADLSRVDFIGRLNAYKADRKVGDRHHKRVCDQLSGAQSPQTLYGVPVGKMLFEGVPRLWRAPVSIPLLRPLADRPIVLEGYPGLRARRLIGRRPYKSDNHNRQNAERRAARRELLSACGVKAPPSVIDDPKADVLDAILCAVQAHWAWQHRSAHFGLPEHADKIEGWIVDPSLSEVSGGV